MDGKQKEELAYCKKQLEQAQVKIKQLKDRIMYLERSNNRREDIICENRFELNDLSDKLNKVRELSNRTLDDYVKLQKEHDALLKALLYLSNMYCKDVEIEYNKYDSNNGFNILDGVSYLLRDKELVIIERRLDKLSTFITELIKIQDKIMSAKLEIEQLKERDGKNDDTL